MAVRGNNRAMVGLQGIGLAHDDVADQPDHSKGLGSKGITPLSASCGGIDRLCHAAVRIRAAA